VRVPPVARGLILGVGAGLVFWGLLGLLGWWMFEADGRDRVLAVLFLVLAGATAVAALHARYGRRR
jgi:hypothetical protein